MRFSLLLLSCSHLGDDRECASQLGATRYGREHPSMRKQVDPKLTHLYNFGSMSYSVGLLGLRALSAPVGDPKMDLSLWPVGPLARWVIKNCVSGSLSG